MRTIEITDIFAELVESVSRDVTIKLPEVGEVVNPDISYIFGNAQYVKDELDIYTKEMSSSSLKFPLVALFTPIVETRDSNDYYSRADVSLIIACSSTRDWSNEQRKVYSFENVLRPIYRRLLVLLKADSRIDWGYDDKIKHTYSENYSYGRYGAYTQSGEAVSEPLDAIDIRSLSLKIKNPIICNRL